MLERVPQRAEKIRRIHIGEILVKFHYDRVRSLLITESDDPTLGGVTQASPVASRAGGRGR